MNQIKQVLLLHQQGVSNRQIARELGMSKDTVNRYVSQAKQDTMGVKGLIEMEDPVNALYEELVENATINAE